MEDSGAASTNYSRSDAGNVTALVNNVSIHDKKRDVTHQIVTNYADISLHGSSLKFLYANLRSICKEGNFDEIKWITEHMSEPIHLLIFTETWIKEETNIELYELPNYEHVYNRRDGRGGGVSIYIYNGIEYDVQEDECKDGNHYLWVYLKKLSLNVGVIYRHGGSVNKFLKEFLPQLQQRSKQRTIVFGDFNVNLLEPEKSEVRNYINVVKETNFVILNKIDKSYTTRDTSKTRKLIDHVCTNINDHSFSMTIIDSCLSDHKQIFLQIKMNKKIKINQKIHKVLDYNQLQESASIIKYSNKDHDYDYLKRFISEQIRKNIKYQVINPPKNYCIYDAINSRNVLGRKKKFCPEETTEMEYEEATERVISLIKVDLVSTRFRDCNNDPKKLLRLINQLVCAKNGSNSKLVIDNNLCEILNYKLSTIGEDLVKNISQRYCTDNKKYTLTYDDNYVHSTTLNELSLFSNEEVSKIIDNLDWNTSTGFDGIGVKAIKCLKDLMIDSLTNCINKCLKNGTFPDELKVAKVRPIYQSGCDTDLDSYQWVTVLPVFSKIFEQALYNRLINYLSEKKVLTDVQYDSRSNSNTLSAAVDLITEIKCRIDQKNIVLGIFIDLKDAFYSVCHQKLLQKLVNIGVRGTALNVFSSYLQNRKQFVQKGASKSSTNILSYGCPQDSIIGRLLFSIYVNNISNMRLKGNLTLYSDNICLLYFNKSIDKNITVAQRDLNRLNEWLKYNNLTINMANTSYMIFAAKNKKIPQFDELQIDNEIIEQSSVIEYHRLFIDNELNWKQHIDYIQSELKLLSQKLHKTADCISKETSIVLYNSLVKPHLEYLINIWGTCSKTNVKPLQNTQNKIIEILNLETKLLNINQLYIYNTCILIRQILTKNIYSRLKLHKKSVSIDLRIIDYLERISARTNYGKKTILFEGAKLYNKLPIEIKNCDDMDSFKIKLEEYVLSKY